MQQVWDAFIIMTEQKDLPWFTEEELQGIAAIHDLALTSGDYDIPTASWQIPVRQFLSARDAAATTADSENEYYRAEVLDKYRSNPYCDIGFDHDNQCHYIRFLNTDRSKPADSIIRFRFTKLADQDVLMVNTIDSIINIPPRQLSHWNQYKHK
jgi:hypothetical protein